MYWFPPTRVKQSGRGTIIGPIFPVRIRRSSFDLMSSPSGSTLRSDFPVPVYPTSAYAAGDRLFGSYFGGGGGANSPPPPRRHPPRRGQPPATERPSGARMGPAKVAGSA